MDTRDEAKKYLDELRLYWAKSFFGMLEKSLKGTGFVLAYLESAQGEVCAGDVARELHVSTARIAALQKAMEKNGLITRSPSQEDARKTVIRITEKGVRELQQIRERMLDKAVMVLERVGRDDAEEFIRISGKIKRALEE